MLQVVIGLPGLRLIVGVDEAPERTDGAHASAPTGFDIAFVDPPFDANLWPAVLDLLPARMAADAWLYLETPAAHAPVLAPEWALHRESGTREVRYALYRRVTLPAVNHVGDPATL